MMKLHKRIARTVAVLTVSLVTAMGLTSLAAAQTTYNIYGYTNTDGSVVDYGVYRQHLAYGPITLQITNGVTNGAYFTMKSQTSGKVLPWSCVITTGQKGWTDVLAGKYGVVAQQRSCSVWQKLVTGCDNYWAGNLTQ